MACRSREELVGKRFLSVKSDGKLKVGKMSEWEWRPGFVRAVSTRDTSSADFTVLVEFDDTGWKSREYIKIHEAFLEFLVEHTLSWVERKATSNTEHCLWPALCFRAVVDKVGIFHQSKRPVEFLNDRRLSIVDEHDITYYREGDESTVPTVKECPDVVKWVKAWTDYQDGQKILLTTPSVLLGYRVEVYRTEGTTQWYTAVIKSYNHANKSLTLTDDTVLEEHNEDPALIQMHLIGDGVVDSILSGVDVGLAQRRRPRSTVTRQSSKESSSIISIGRSAASYQPGSNSYTVTHSSSNITSSTSSPVNAANRSGHAKSRETLAADINSSPCSAGPETSSTKVGHSQQKNQKQTPKRKSDPRAKAARKPSACKKIKKSSSEENLEGSSSVCKQTCNVVVKRIEEETQRSALCKDKPKSKAPRLREKQTQNRKQPDGDENSSDELVKASLNPVNSLRSNIEASLGVSLGGSKQRHNGDVVQTDDGEEEEVKATSNKKAANVSTEDSEKQLQLSAARTELSPGNAEGDVINHLCDNSKQFSGAASLASVVSNGCLNPTSAASCAYHTSTQSLGCSTQKDTGKQSTLKVKETQNDFVNENSKSHTSGEVPQDKTSPDLSTLRSDTKSDEDMHYKKQILRAGSNINPSQNVQSASLSSGVDVSRSPTEQLPKIKTGDKFNENGEGKSTPECVDVTDTLSSLSHRQVEQESSSFMRGHDFLGNRHSAFTSVSRSNPATPAAVDRADSRASDGQLSAHVTEDKLGSRFDDIRSVRSSPGTSPLVIDRHEAINPYRDPELMRQNPVQSNVQNILAAQHIMSKPAYPSAHVPFPGATAPSQTIAGFAGAQTHPARALLSTLPSTLPYANSHQLSSSLSHHLALPHAYSMDAVVRAQQHIAALQQQQQQQQQHLMNYTLSSAPGLSTLEALWQHKFPTTPLTTPYMLQKSTDAILPADLASVLHREHLQHQMDRERRELDRIDKERRERLEQEIREKERKEILERERQEKEKAERVERERLEKERERLEWGQHKHNQERILDTEAAVDQHFAESLTRLACQQQGITMFPSVARGRGLIPKAESHLGLPPHGLSYHEKKLFEHRTEDQVKKELEPLPDDKHYINKLDTEKNTVFPGYAYGVGGYHTSTSLPQPSQKPFFNLYGYPSSHSTITPEQLKQRGLNPELKQVKEEFSDKKHPYSSVSPHAPSPVHISQAFSSKDVKREPHNSVIVKRESNPLKMENPVTAHSHHSYPSSSSSPRPQHPRPAHTPEHRPDRPLPSSASPASGMHTLLLHHSNPVPPSSNHPLPSPNTAFHTIDTHAHPTSQSPYKPAASQSQHQPLNFCKSSGSKLKEQQQITSVTQGYPSVAQTPVSLPDSSAYSYSLIQQGLVPNPIYSSIGNPHPSGPSHLTSQGPRTAGASSPNSALESKHAQLSPSGNKRKTGSKDNNAYNRKKSKGHTEISCSNQHVSIPQSTPQIITNPSPYTITSGNSAFTKPGVSSLTSSSSPSLIGTSHSDVDTGFINSFKSFVENTVQTAYFQDEKKMQEKEERERISSFPVKADSHFHDSKLDSNNQPLPAGSYTAASPAAYQQDVPQHSMHDAYSSRIMDTINRVANNQADTDSDTLSASSPPPQIKPSDTNSPLGKSGNSGHPHHMKKAWLQRHDEDKKSETPVPTHGEEDSNSSLGHTRDISSCVENSCAAIVEQGQESNRSSPADIVVTLSNGNIKNLCHSNYESTSSASEAEMEGDSQAAEEKNWHDSFMLSSNISKQPSRAKERNNKVSVPTSSSSQSPHTELSNPSPVLSESQASPASAASPDATNASSKTGISGNKENKDKKKPTRQNKEQSKDNKKNSSFSKPLVKTSVSILKRTMMPFIQDGPCSEITPKLNKCRECKMTPVQRSKKQPNIFCRFYAFRRLKYNSRGIVTIHGFSELSDADPDDIEPWLPRFPVEEPELDVENSKFIIAKVGDKFCELVEQEKGAKSWAGDDVNVVWKRAVVGVREMCDVCDTTLFNMHWVCQKCGFVVCLDCYHVRIKEGKKPLMDDKWLTCSSNRQAHKASEMMLTQIIPSDALWELGRLIHDIRIKWSIPSNCPCGGNSMENTVTSKNGIKQQIVNSVSTHKFPNGCSSDEHANKHSKSKKNQDSNPLKNFDAYSPDTTSSPLSILAEVAAMEPDSSKDKTDAKRKVDKSVAPENELSEESEKKSGCSTLRELLTKTAGKPKGANEKRTKKSSVMSTLDNIIQSVVEKSCTDGGAPFKFLHYTPRLGGWKRELPIMIHSLTETSVLYPDVPHSWLCDGRLLRLHDAHHKGNLQIFQEQWTRGQPVLVSCANNKMNINLWKPELFSKEFGHIENEVVNCRTGDVIIGHTMGDFWDGFESQGNRPTDGYGEPMLLKLKDWPPGDDFSELMPTRFQDLMQALPLPEYTQRNGKLNLASRLPDFLVRPDLGPKMYNAYGSSHFPKEGTTNLHLDISDAVNVMVYVGVPSDGPGGRKSEEEAALKAIDDAGCDIITKKRVREVHEIPGALWHIYDAHDADKIRDFLNKVAKERGESIEKDHDAIHDQSWYLDKELCDRLLKEYGVQGYTIVQCLGDAVFIPAGAPHQVRNLHSCVKVAEDFVSPEHLNHCFRLTQEFRQLSETHSNHEDKLQVKNIIYHAVKDAIAVLRENDPEDE